MKGGYLEIQEHSTPSGGMLTITQDISERKWAEQSLRNSAEFQRTLIDAMPLPAFYKNFEGEYLGCNTAFAEFFGLSKAEIMGKTVFDFDVRRIGEDLHCGRRRGTDRKGGPRSFEAPARAADGSLHDYHR